MGNSNLILYDWFSFTVLRHRPVDCAALLGLEFAEWQMLKGFYGYKSRMYYEGISIHYDGSVDQGCLVEMSGAGCRTFESRSQVTWPVLFELLFDLPEEDRFHPTRLDIAFDDHTGILPIDQIIEDTKNNNWVSPFRWAKIEVGCGENKGKSLYFGSPQSESRIRIYDKAAERNAESEGHWIRIEMQLRRDNALLFLKRRKDIKLSELFLGTLSYYLRFVSPTDDTNKSRWPDKQYWTDLLDGVSKVNIFSAPGQAYNRDRLEAFVYGMAANAVYAAMCIDGDQFFSKITDIIRRSGHYPLKYLSLIREYQNTSVSEFLSDVE